MNFTNAYAMNAKEYTDTLTRLNNRLINHEIDMERYLRFMELAKDRERLKNEEIMRQERRFMR